MSTFDVSCVGVSAVSIAYLCISLVFRDYETVRGVRDVCGR